MKWFIVIALFTSNCAAVEHVIQVASIPSTPADNVTRIVGGHSTYIEKYPYAVQILHKDSFLCGGSLITLRHVLSAAHCFTRLFLEDYYVIVGSTNRMKGGTTRTISRLVKHPSFNTSIELDNDVAVSVLNKNLRSGLSIRAGLLPRQGEEVPDNSIVWAVGWGTTAYNVKAPPDTLQEVQLRTVNRAVCAKKYQTSKLSNFTITSNMICSEGQEGGSCHGDSGGPLVYSGIIVGVVSFGDGCVNPSFPGVYAMTSAYINWINHTLTMYNAGPPVGSISGLIFFSSLISALLLGSQLPEK